jgi:hypothetical protein
LITRVYENAHDEIGATAIEFTFDGKQPLQVGGYSALAPGKAMPCCEKCNRVIRTLSNIHESKGLGSRFVSEPRYSSFFATASQAQFTPLFALSQRTSATTAFMSKYTVRNRVVSCSGSLPLVVRHFSVNCCGFQKESNEGLSNTD